jgi:hypothetical protein
MNRDLEILINRAASLVFGIFSQIEANGGEREVRFGGSGIFVAPFQTLTARHVTRDLSRVNPERVDDLNKRVRDAEQNARSFYTQLPHSSALFQASFGRAPRALIWHVHRVWDSVVTDVSFMEVNAEGDEAASMERQMAGFFEWSLLPPPVGSNVVMLGYPQTVIRSQGGLMNIDIMYVMQDGQVTDIYEPRRDYGMFSFPCFRINKPVDHGFSGGPIFWENRLCGIVSGGFDEETYAASLWPLCLLEYEYPDMGAIGSKRMFADLLESGVIRSPDWPQLRGRIEKLYDKNGKPYARIVPQESA